MKKFIFILLLLSAAAALFPETITQFRIKNQGLAYNGENGTYWEETRYTLTYFEDVVQPYLDINVDSNVEFKLGAGFLIPFNQEEKIFNYYPYVQSRFMFQGFTLMLGSLDGNHDFPPAILDPLVNMTPEMRVITKSQVPVTYETFPYGIDSHGMYEYGLEALWDQPFGKGDLYMNWQLPDTTNHRERFDVGLIHKTDPFYAGLHYWHNGGHENPHPVSITEDYTGAFGLRNTNFSVLYLCSYFIPDREFNPRLNVFGEGIYLEYNFSLFDLQWQSQLFVSDEFINTNHQYISIEGDPFYRVPFYFGLNIYRTFHIEKDIDLKIGFVNGVFMPHPGTQFSWLMIRYDQMMKADMEFAFDIK